MEKRTGKKRDRQEGDDGSPSVLSPIRIARQKAGLTEDELAQRVGVSQSYISKLERALITLKPKIAERIAKHVPASPRQLFVFADEDLYGKADPQGRGLQEEGEAFEADGGTASAGPAIAGKPLKFSPFKINTDDLAAFGYPRGTVLAVDFEPHNVAQPANGSLVIVEVTTGGTVRHLARQYVAPDRLRTGSGRTSGAGLSTGDAGVTIVGLIHGSIETSPLRKSSVKRRRQAG